MPRTAAPPRVPRRSTSQVPSQSSGSGAARRETKAAMRSASNMFWLSAEADPSVPMPTASPQSSIRRAGAMPEPRRRLLPGLWATEAPRSRISFTSSSSSQMQWAPVKLGASRPRVSRWRASVVP